MRATILCLALLIGAAPAGAAPAAHGQSATAQSPAMKAFAAKVEATKQAMMGDPAIARKSAEDLLRMADTMKRDGSVSARDAAISSATARWLLAEAYIGLNDAPRAKSLVAEALTSIQSGAPGSKLNGDLLRSRATLSEMGGDVQGALKDYLSAHRIFRAIGEARSRAIALQDIGNLYLEAADFDRVQSYYSQSLEAFSEDPWLNLATYNNRGQAYREQGNFAKAEAEYGLALKAARQLESQLLEARILTNLAETQYELGKLDQALATLARAESLVAQGGEAAGWHPFILGVRAMVEARRGDPAKAGQLMSAAFAGQDLAKTEMPFRELHEAATGIYEKLGERDVTGALSPLDYNNLTWYQMSDKGQAKPMSSATLRSQGATQLGNWEAKGMYFYAFENIGGTYRDFAIPLSSKLFDSKALSAGSTKEQFQAYLYNQVTRWMKTGASFTDRPSLNFTASSASVGARSGLNIMLSSAPRTIRGNGLRFGQSPYQSSLRLASPEGRFALQMGEGDGAIELGNIAGFGRASDYDPSQGGANPILGMASGGAFGKVSYSFNDALSISAGFTEQDIRYDFRAMSLQQQNSYAGIEGYRTGASTVSVAYRPVAGVELTGAYTRLAEKDGILGIQSLSSDVIGKGATTDGMTLGATWQATPTLQIAASATSGRTRAGSDDTLVTTGGGGFRTSAYQVTLAKQHVFDSNDALRLSMAQPLHVDSGSLDVSSVQVIDRETGQLGLVTERFDLPGSKRPLIGAFQYARSVMDGQADVALFGQARLRGEQSIDQAAGVMAGARFNLRF